MWRVIEMNAGDPDLYPGCFKTVDDAIEFMIQVSAERECRTPEEIRDEWFADTENSAPMVTRYDNANGSVTLADDRGDWQVHIVKDEGTPQDYFPYGTDQA